MILIILMVLMSYLFFFKKDKGNDKEDGDVKVSGIQFASLICFSLVLILSMEAFSKADYIESNKMQIDEIELTTLDGSDEYIKVEEVKDKRPNVTVNPKNVSDKKDYHKKLFDETNEIQYNDNIKVNIVKYNKEENPKEVPHLTESKNIKTSSLDSPYNNLLFWPLDISKGFSFDETEFKRIVIYVPK